MHGGDIYNNDVDIDFSVNLNPYEDNSIREKLVSAAMEGLHASDVYPDITQSCVRTALAGFENVPKDCVYAASGASELISGIVHALSPKTALLAEPCFSGYRRALQANGCSISVYLQKESDGFSLTSDFLSHITEDTDMLFLTDPQNPSGRNIDRKLLLRILERAKECSVAAVIDESFLPLSGKYLKEKMSARYESLIRRFDNVYIIKSFTKCFALPGIRMGYCISREENINALIPHLPEWNLSSVAGHLMPVCAEIAEKTGFFRDSIDLIEKEKKYLAEELTKAGYIVFDSDTVFLLIKGEPGLYERLLSKGILIRRCDDMPGLGEGFYRIAVRDHKDNERLVGDLR